MTMADFISDATSGAVGGAVSGLAVLALQIYLQRRWERERALEDSIVGHGGLKELAINFFDAYQPGILIDKVIEALGQPDSIENCYGYKNEPLGVLPYFEYKFTFSNATAIFVTKNISKQVIAITVEGFSVKAPINIPLGPASEQSGSMPQRGKIDKYLIENANRSYAENYAAWGYSALECSWGGYKKLKELTYTYITYEGSYDKPEEFEGRQIHQVCVSSSTSVHPVIYFYENN